MPTKRATTTFGRLTETKQWETICETMRSSSRTLLTDAKDDTELLHAAHRAVAVEELIRTVDAHAHREQSEPLQPFEVV